MRVEKRSRATVALAAAGLLLGVMTIWALLITPRSNQDVTSQSLQAQPAPPPSHEINKSSPPVIATDAQAAKPPVTPVDPSGVLSISGSVLNPQGERLADIEIIAASRRVFTNQYDKQASELSTTTDAVGDYRFAGLGPGDYRLRTVETPLYPSASIHVRAGSDAVNLVLAPRQYLWIYGVVKDNAGNPLGDVHIVPNRDPRNAAYSDTAGNFSLFQTVHGSAQSQDSLHFSLDGYHNKRVMLRVSDPYASDLALGDVRLERIEGQALVRGSVAAGDAPVAHARVFLRSTERSNYYDTTTDAGGYFAMQDVVIGDYEITVVPRAQYQDYTDSEIKVNESGLDLRIALESLHSATLRGRMVDVSGSPVPGFSLWLTSLSARARGGLPITGDTRGVFEVGSLPAGELVFTTRSNPRLRITGADVSGPDDPPLELVLDVGDDILNGQVVDAYSYPVPGAQVSLIWAQETGGITSHSLRNTTTDTTGNFRFSRLGRGVHTLTVNAIGYQHRRIEQDIGVEDEVHIELEAPAVSRAQ